ncbi:MAG: IS4 family transposase [Spirulinaceae cyanobacterium RM2_2_10]|nr:IS4 family transposase [Spirulinaceae cyanobacterium RM2_2_10]
MLPQSYQKCLQGVLTPKQYVMVEILLTLLQTRRDVRLERLAKYWTQAIQHDSRRRALQRFLLLPHLTPKLLWFALIKALIKQQYRQPGNHSQRRRQKKLTRLLKCNQMPLILVIDRSQWRQRNLFMVGVAWQGRALPIDWQLLPKCGNSNLREQKALLTPVLRLLKGYQLLLVADREFHSPKLAEWLQQRGVDFALRQKRNVCIQQQPSQDYQALGSLDIQPGARLFLRDIYSTKTHQSGSYHLAVRWQRGYRCPTQPEVWYILTSLPSYKATIAIFKLRFGIEPLFRDLKTGGYHIEHTHVSEPCFLALVLLVAMAYTWTALQGLALRSQPDLALYLSRRPQPGRSQPHHSHFQLAFNAHLWQLDLPDCRALNAQLRALNPHKRHFYERGLRAQSLLQSCFQPLVTL